MEKHERWPGTSLYHEKYLPGKYKSESLHKMYSHYIAPQISLPAELKMFLCFEQI